MRAILLASVAVAVMPRAFMSETSETVFVTSKDWKDPVRINKSDYDADQDEKGEKRYTLAKSAEAPELEPLSGTGPITPVEGLIIPPAPSAPAFIDAVAPTTASADTLFITKGKGAKARFYVVDANNMPVANMRDIDPKGYDTEELAIAALNAVKRQPHEQGAPNVGTSGIQPGAGLVSDVPPVETPKT
jgi:hypothetical protein